MMPLSPSIELIAYGFNGAGHRGLPPHSVREHRQFVYGFNGAGHRSLPPHSVHEHRQFAYGFNGMGHRGLTPRPGHSGNTPQNSSGAKLEDFNSVAAGSRIKF